MILGIIGPTTNDTEMVLDCILNATKLKSVDTNHIIRTIKNHNYKNNLIADNSNKKFLLKNLENHMGSLVATGNLVLTEEVCKWLLDNGHSVAVVARSSMSDYDPVEVSNQRKYWGEENILKYELEDRYKAVYDKLTATQSKNLYWIDLSTDSEDLERLCTAVEGESSTECDIDTIINQFNEDEDRMTIQESIQKAMKELGIDLNSTEEPTTKESTPKTTKKAVKEVSVDTTINKEPKPILEQKSEDSNTVSKLEEAEPSPANELYVKATTDAMAIMIPTTLKMDTREIGGETYYVATVALPDLNNRSLQVLRTVSGNNQTKPASQLINTPKTEVKPVEQKPVVESKAEPKPRSNITVSGTTLEELTAEKHEWDAKIKEARSAGNIDLVNEYRKHRRAVRAKINALKKTGDMND